MLLFSLLCCLLNIVSSSYFSVDVVKEGGSPLNLVSVGVVSPSFANASNLVLPGNVVPVSGVSVTMLFSNASSGYTVNSLSVISVIDLDPTTFLPSSPMSSVVLSQASYSINGAAAPVASSSINTMASLSSYGATAVQDVINDLVLIGNNVAASSIPSASPLSVASSSFTATLNFNCSSTVTGYSLVTTSLITQRVGSILPEAPLTFSFIKQCGSVNLDGCLHCSFCLQDNTCECKKGSLGYQCINTVTATVHLGSAQATTSTIFSYNVNGLGTKETVSQVATRLSSIADSILAMPVIPSIVCLQEVWSEVESDGDSFKALLFKKLAPVYSNIIVKSFYNGPVNYDSGLFFATTHNLVDSDFQAFANFVSYSDDGKRNKGFQVLTLDLVSAAIVIVNLDLQSSAGLNTTLIAPTLLPTIRQMQVQQMMFDLGGKVTKAKSTNSQDSIAVFAVGTFNVLAQHSEYCSLNLQGAQDILVIKDVLTPTVSDGTTLDYAFNWVTFNELGAVTNTTSMIDTMAKIDFATANVVTNFDLSTHNPLTFSYVVPRIYDPSLVIGAITFSITMIAIIALLVYRTFLIKPIKRKLVEADMEANFLQVYYRQMIILSIKNIRLQTRSKRALVMQLSVPFVFVFFLFLLQQAININAKAGGNQGTLSAFQPVPIPLVQRCIVPRGASSCVTVAYSPQTPIVKSIMTTLGRNNAIEDSIMGFDSQDDVNNYMLANPLQVAAGVEFIISGNQISYSTQFNNTALSFNFTTYAPLQVAVDTAIMQTFTNQSTLQYLPKLSTFTHPAIGSTDVVATSGHAFFFGALMFNFVILVGQLVTEKEFLLRQGMETMGLNGFIYWNSWLLTSLGLNTITGASLIIGGYAFGFPFFVKNDPGLYIVLFFLFGLAMVSYAFFISLFLSKSRTATSVGFALYLFGVMTQSFISIIFTKEAGANETDFFCTLPFVMLAEGVDQLSSAVAQGGSGLRWRTRFTNAYYPMSNMYSRLLTIFVEYYLIALVYDFFFAKEDLQGWCCRNNKRRRNKNKEEQIKKTAAGVSVYAANKDDVNAGIPEEVKQEAINVNSDTKNERYAIRIVDLYKEYQGSCLNGTKNFVAVNGLNLAVLPGELLCLLGPNGAGKTTTIKMMTGMHLASDGDAFINGKSIRTSSGMRDIRKSLGFCPQHDILWPELSAREHLRLYAGFKNIPDALIESEVDDRLEDVKLQKWSNAPCGSYSGGMKRRLSVAIALIGSPSVVFLDEPTTGMDPVSRRQVWELIGRVKKDRAVVLTTHSMEEADCLGDRIAIMRKGQLMTVGSSIFLKNKFGNGFRLSFQSTSGNFEKVYPIVASHLQTPHYFKNRKSGLTIEIPRSKLKELPRLVADLESNASKLGVKNIELSISTLQDVFLKVAGEDEGGDDDDDEEGEGDPLLKKPATIGEALNSGSNSIFGMFRGKSVHKSYNDLDNTQHDAQTADKSSLKKASQANDKNVANPLLPPTIHHDEAESTRALPSEPEIVFPGFSWGSQMKAMFTKSWLNQKRAKMTNCAQICIPCGIIFLLYGSQVFVNQTLNQVSTTMTSRTAANPHPSPIPSYMIHTDASKYSSCAIDQALNAGKYPLYSSAGAKFVSSYEISSQGNWIGNYGGSADQSLFTSVQNGQGMLGSVTKDITRMQEVYGYFDASEYAYFTCTPNTYETPINFNNLTSRASVEKYIYDSFGNNQVAGAYVFNNLDPVAGVFDYIVASNKTVTGFTDVPLLINYISEAIFKTLMGPSSSLVFQGVRSFPSLKPTPLSLDIISIAGPYLYIYVFQLLMPVFLGAIVYDKEHGLREAMKMMGLKKRVYWGITYLFNYIIYSVVTSFTILVAMFFGFKVFIVNNILMIIALFAIWGHTLLAFSLFLSVFFTKTSGSTVVGYIYVFAIGILSQTLITPYICDVSTPAACTPASTPHEVLLIVSAIPQWAFYRGLYELTKGVQGNRPGLLWSDFGQTYSDGNYCYMGEVFTILIIEWFVFMILAAYLELVWPSPIGVKLSPFFPFYWIRNKICPRTIIDTSADVKEYPEDEPEDAKAERNRTYDDKKPLLRILNLRKEYEGLDGMPPHVAVHNLTFSVDSGNCFGFLGSNGAGKSTTCNMLCGYFGPTRGTAVILGKDIRTEIDEIHMILGVCPQGDVIWEDLTGREHLQFYGRLKGLKGDSLKAAVDHRLGELDLLDKGDVKAGAYSGGMKRRLCVAIALVGNPRVVILDEPSTGLDPKARKDLWRVIRNATKKAAVLLITHSMEEAESLCSNIGIFIGGKINCIGSAPDLKHRFGDGYYIHIACKRKDDAEEMRKIEVLVEDYLKSELEGVVLLNSLNGTLNFQVSGKSTTLSHILTSVVTDERGSANKLKKAALEAIEDWGVENTTLEQVFVSQTAGIKLENLK